MVTKHYSPKIIAEPINLKHFSKISVDAEWCWKDTEKVERILKKSESEWDLVRGRKAKFLTKQLTTHTVDGERNSIVIWDSNYPLPTNLPVFDHPVSIYLSEGCEATLSDVALLPKKLDILFYYSPKDIEATVGEEVWKEALLGSEHKGMKKVSKKRNLKGSFELVDKEGGKCVVKLDDWVGAFNSSLENALLSVGMNTEDKVLSKEFADHLGVPLNTAKSRMEEWILWNPHTFLKYALGDSMVMEELSIRRVNQVNKMIAEALGDDIPPFTIEDFPRSSGSLVAKTFENWMIAYHPKLYAATMLLSSGEEPSWKTLCKTKNELEMYLDGQGGDLKVINHTLRSDSHITHGLGQAGIMSFRHHSNSDATGLYGAVVQGGRCVNEDVRDSMYAQTIDHVVDIDLSSCYGTALRDFDYPLGLPTIFQNKVDDHPISLRQFLLKYERELVDGLYTIYVTGTLPFQQDLIHSKYNLSPTSIAKALHNGLDEGEFDEDLTQQVREIEAAHLGGDFVLTRKEIKLGIITSENMKTLKAVCSNKEWKAINDLVVECAVYYPRNKEVTHQEFIEIVGDKFKRGSYTREGDTRTRQWTRLPLREFIGKFIDYRAKMKKQSKVDGKGSEADLIQNAVKLFINTTYGDLAAPFFPMGNTVLANNITAKARTGVWLLSKALLTVQSITDGGMFSWKEVAYLDPTSHQGKKPGLEQLSVRKSLKNHRSITLAPLTNENVLELVKQPGGASTLDKLCTEHIQKFWAHYGLSLPFGIECKTENTGVKAAWFGSGDYIIDTFDKDGNPKLVIKSRGAKQDDHPKKEMLRHILYPHQYPKPSGQPYTYSQSLGVSEYQKNPNKYAHFLPGDDMEKNYIHKPYSFGQVFQTYQEWKAYQEAKSKAERRHDKEVKAGGCPKPYGLLAGKGSRVSKGVRTDILRSV